MPLCFYCFHSSADACVNSVNGGWPGKDAAPGLTMEVFTNDKFSGVPVEKRIDAVVNTRAETGGYGFTMREGAEKQAIRWTGILISTFTGKHEVGVEGAGNLMYIDGKLLVDTSGPYPWGATTAIVSTPGALL
jgi:hypothetical protein